MERGHIPERTCRGCGCKKERAGLIRFVIRDGVLIEDQLRQRREGAFIVAMTIPAASGWQETENF